MSKYDWAWRQASPHLYPPEVETQPQQASGGSILRHVFEAASVGYLAWDYSQRKQERALQSYTDSLPSVTLLKIPVMRISEFYFTVEPENVITQDGSTIQARLFASLIEAIQTNATIHLKYHVLGEGDKEGDFTAYSLASAQLSVIPA